MEPTHPRRLGGQRAAAALTTTALLSLLGGCGDVDDPVDPPPDPALKAYVALVLQAEQRTAATPRTMLSMLRKIYYGEPWSVSSTNVLWRFVIPCGLNLKNPRAELGDELFNALGSAAETGGVDFGHVFAALEAMVCPTSTVVTVKMSNEDFASWGGDLGAAVAARAACKAMGKDAATVADCGSKAGGQPLDFYVQHHAPSQDLEGDLDPFAMRAALLGAPCAASRLKPLALDRPLSDVLGDYYLRPSSALGQARQRRDRCILELLGATFDASGVANRATIVDQVSVQLASFAEAYYATIRPATPDAAEKASMLVDARAVTDDLLKQLTP